jgi:hypothetical protein
VPVERIIERGRKRERGEEGKREKKERKKKEEENRLFTRSGKLVDVTSNTPYLA